MTEDNSIPGVEQIQRQGKELEIYRDSGGKFMRTAQSAKRDREAFVMRANGYTLNQISDALGFGGPSNALKAIKREMDAIDSPLPDQTRLLMDEHLDKLQREAMKVLDDLHLQFFEGQAITFEGVPVTDSVPVLKAIDTLLKVQERRAKLWGVDKPEKMQVQQHVMIEIVGLDTDAV